MMPAIPVNDWDHLKPGDLWPVDYERRSRIEGWLLTNDSKGRVYIAKLDDPEAAEVAPNNDFEYDEDAVAYVLSCATSPHPASNSIHMMALYLAGRYWDEPLGCQIPSPLLTTEVVQYAVDWQERREEHRQHVKAYSEQAAHPRAQLPKTRYDQAIDTIVGGATKMAAVNRGLPPDPTRRLSLAFLVWYRLYGAGGEETDWLTDDFVAEVEAEDGGFDE